MSRELFIRRLAEYLVKDQVKKGILLGMGNKHMEDWATLREASPLLGHPSVEDAEVVLHKFLTGCRQRKKCDYSKARQRQPRRDYD